MIIASLFEKQWHFLFLKQAWQSSCYCSTQISWRAIFCANRYSSPESNIWFKFLIRNVNIDLWISEIVKSVFSTKIRLWIVPHTLNPMTRETVVKNLKRDTNWQGWEGYACGIKCENGEIQSRLETMFDDILRVLTENNYIQYNCFSTVCHYVYRGKK